MDKQKQLLALVAAVCLAIGFVAARPEVIPHNPFQPKPDRPVLKFLAKIAKLGLWVAMFAEPARQSQPPSYGDSGNEGSEFVCHMEGW